MEACLRSKLSRLKDKLDIVASEAVRKRDGKCLVCGKTENLQAHHWLIRRAKSNATRWEPDNLATLCYYCHICQVHRYSDKDFMDRFYRIMDTKVPKERQEELRQMASHPVKLSESDLIEKLKALRGGK